jgi:hypothetical protein
LDAATISFLALGALGGAAVVAVALKQRRGNGRAQSRPALSELLKHLPPELAGRYLGLVEMDKHIRQTIRAHGLEPVMGDQLAKLDFLLASYLRLAQEMGRFRTHLQGTPPGAVEKEAERIRERLSGAEGETAILVQQNLSVVEKRLEKLNAIRLTAARLKTQLDTIEDTVRLINDQALTASATDGFDVDIDRVVGMVEATDASLAETRGFLSERANTGAL